MPHSLHKGDVNGYVSGEIVASTLTGRDIDDGSQVAALLDQVDEHVVVALIDRAEHEIDLAADVLTDWPVMQALTRAADRGVKIRIYLDGTQFAEREPPKVFHDLAETPGVEIKTKHKAAAPMHLKSYQIDGGLLRTGASPLLDLQKQCDQFALAMRVRLGKDGFQLIARRLPGNLQFAGGDIGRGAARRPTGRIE